MAETVSDTASRHPPSMFLGKGAPKDGDSARLAKTSGSAGVEMPGLPMLIVLAFVVSTAIGWLILSGTAATWLRPTLKTELASDLRRLPATEPRDTPEAQSTGVKG